MKQFLFFWVVSFIFLVVLDLLWFKITLETVYKPLIGHIISENFKYNVAAAFYLLYSAGLSFLVLKTGMEADHSLLRVCLSGGLLGLVSYGAYDLTNQATIEGWPLQVTIIDMLWGTTATALVSGISYKIAGMTS